MTTLISFQLRHPTSDLADIATATGFPIARIWTAGKDRQTPKGDPLEGVYQESYVAFKVITAEETISAAIAAIDAALREALKSQPILEGQELEKSLYCTLMAQGETIDCESLRRLTEWGIRLEIAGCPGP